MSGISVDPAIAVLIGTCGALLFAAAAVHKWRDLRRFEAILAAYELLPRSARTVAAALPPVPGIRLATLVPALETAVAAGLLLRLSVAAAAAAALLLVYAGAIGSNLLRGRRDLACGCSGPADRRPIAPWMVWRNVVMAILLLALLLPTGSRVLTATDAVTIVFGTACSALVFLCVERLSQRSRPRTAELSWSQ